MSPSRPYTRQELLRYDGEDQPQKLIAFRGIVYDVTDCPKWRLALHEGQHFPGQDLTNELESEAPHHEEVFFHDCVKTVGWLLGYSVDEPPE